MYYSLCRNITFFSIYSIKYLFIKNLHFPDLLWGYKSTLFIKEERFMELQSFKNIIFNIRFFLLLAGLKVYLRLLRRSNLLLVLNYFSTHFANKFELF